MIQTLEQQQPSPDRFRQASGLLQSSWLSTGSSSSSRELGSRKSKTWKWRFGIKDSQRVWARKISKTKLTSDRLHDYTISCYFYLDKMNTKHTPETRKVFSKRTWSTPPSWKVDFLVNLNLWRQDEFKAWEDSHCRLGLRKQKNKGGKKIEEGFMVPLHLRPSEPQAINHSWLFHFSGWTQD